MRGPATSEHATAKRWRKSWLYPASALAAWLAGISGAHAQIAVNATLASNDIYRGRSLSADDPALSLAVGIDDASGFYAGGSVAVAAGDRDVRISSSSQYAGYAWRSGRTSFEIGAIHRHHSDSLDPEYAKDFFEGYVGLSHGKSNIRLYLSPDYIPGDRISAYVSLNTELAKVGDWSIAGHGGLAVKPSHGTPGHDYKSEADWSLSLGRAIGDFNLSVGVADSTDSDPVPFDGPLFFATVSRAF